MYNIEMKPDLFKDVKFYIVDDIEDHDKVKKLLLDGGAKLINYLSDMVTHVIADNADSPDVSEAQELFEKPVVTNQWVKMSAKCGTLLPISGFSPTRTQMFSSIVACPSQMSESDTKAVWAMITFYGGNFQLDLTKNCTHLIAAKPEGAKYERALQTHEQIKIVTPDWVVDSVKNKMVCDEDLYHPRLLILPEPEQPKLPVISSSEHISEVMTTRTNLVSEAEMTLTLQNQNPPNSHFAPRIVSIPSIRETKAAIDIGESQDQVKLVTLPHQYEVTQSQLSATNADTPSPQQQQMQQFLQQQQPHIQQQLQALDQQQSQLSSQQIQQKIKLLRQQQQIPRHLLQQQQLQKQIQQKQQQFVQQRLQWHQQQSQQQQQQLGMQFVQKPQQPQQSQHLTQQLLRLRQLQDQMQQQQLPGQQQQYQIQNLPRQKTLQFQQQTTPGQSPAQLLQQRPPMVQQQHQTTNQPPVHHLPQRHQLIQQQQQHHQPATHGQPPVQHLSQQPQLIQQSPQLRQQLYQQQQQTFFQQQQQVVQTSQATHAPGPNTLLQQRQQSMNTSTTQPPVLTGQPQVALKPPPQYPFSEHNQLTGQPRLQFPPQSPQQLNPEQRMPFQQQQQQIQPRELLQQQTQHVVRWAPSTPKEDSQEHVLQRKILWQQRQAQLDPDLTQSQQTPVWPQQQQTSSQEQNTQLQQQILQWQQRELQRRQKLLQQQKQQQVQKPLGQVQLISRPPPEYPGGATSQVSLSPGSQPNITTVPCQQSLVHTSGGIQQGIQTPPQMTTGQSVAQVKPKTKTALANLLNNRLLGSVKGADGTEDGQIPSKISQIQTPAAQQPSASTDGKNGQRIISPQATVGGVSFPGAGSAAVASREVTFYGHDPLVQVPGDLSLLGCVFCIEDYDRSIEEDKLFTWSKVIEQHGGEVENSYSSRCSHVLCEKQRNSVVQQAMREGKRCVTAYWLNDVLLQKKMRAPWQALHFPSPFSDEKPCKNWIIAVTNFEGEERSILKQMIITTGAKYTGYMTRLNSLLVTKRQEGKKCEKAREWGIPVVNVQWLNDVLFGHLEALRLPMAQKYQQYSGVNQFKVDYALVPHLMTAWRVPIKITEEMWKKFLPGARTKLNADAELENKKRRNEGDDTLDIKKQRLSPELEENIPLTTNNPPPEGEKPYVMFTALKNTGHLSRIVIQLGGRLAPSAKECSHLVINKFARTVKFLCAINVVKYVVTSDWLLESERQNRFVDEKPYILEDQETEKQFGVKIKQTLKRRCRGPLFKNMVFFITPGVFPPPLVLKDIIECGGGTVVLKRRPTYRQIKAMAQTGTTFHVITCDNDLHLCKDFVQKKIGVHNAEFILTGVLRQNLDFSAFLYT